MLEESKISILIVTHNSYPDIKITIDSIVANIINVDYEIILVDNNSNEKDILDFLEDQSKISNIRVVPLNVNLGFGRANNLAFSLASYENILILNPDIIFDANSEQNILKLIKFVEQDDRIGAVSPVLLKPNGKIDKNYHYEIKFFQTLVKRFKKILFKDKSNEEYLPSNTLTKVSSLAGAFILIKSRNYELIKGFDESYFMYSEDIDFSLKLRSYGLDLYLFSDLFFNHNVGSSSRKKQYRMIYEMYKSTAQLFFKWKISKFFKKTLLFIIATPFVIIELLIRSIKRNKNVSD